MGGTARAMTAWNRASTSGRCDGTASGSRDLLPNVTGLLIPESQRRGRYPIRHDGKYPRDNLMASAE
jgi:hypothetical protein